MLSVEFVLWFIWAITKFSFSLFVHDPSFTMVKCRKCSTLSIRRTEETSRVHVFCFPKCGLNHIAVRGPLLECHSKNIWFRVEQTSPPVAGAEITCNTLLSDCHSNSASCWAPQIQCEIQIQIHWAPQWLQTRYLFTFFRSPLLIVKPLAIYNRQKAYDCISWRAIRERCNCKQLRWI